MTNVQKILAGIVGTAIIASVLAGILVLMQEPLPTQEPRPTPIAEPTPEKIPTDLAAHIASKSDLIVLNNPTPLTSIASPLTVQGMARGTWFFEASFPITLVDWDGKIIAQSYATAVLNPNDPESTWMTEEFVPFTGTIEFSNPSFPNTDASHFSHRGAIILQKDNPSGLPQYDDALEIPILFE